MRSIRCVMLFFFRRFLFFFLFLQKLYCAVCCRPYGALI